MERIILHDSLRRVQAKRNDRGGRRKVANGEGGKGHNNHRYKALTRWKLYKDINNKNSLSPETVGCIAKKSVFPELLQYLEIIFIISINTVQGSIVNEQPSSSTCILFSIKVLNWLKNPYWQSHKPTAEIIDF